jgi:hypothetical protein
MIPGLNERQLYRFLIKIKFTEACWYWEGAKNDSGYGYWGFQGKVRPAHVYSYQIFKGEIPAGFELDHICRNHSCLNPFHLEAVSHSVNVQRGVDFKVKTNQGKTHCIRGHPLSGTNLLLRKNGKWRRCRICNNEHARNYWRTRTRKATIIPNLPKNLNLRLV